MTVLLTRPWKDSLAFAGILRGHGIDSVIAPLLTIVHEPVALPRSSDVQACVVTSANGADALERATGERSVPVLAVGMASAERARNHGFIDVTVADGDLASLAVLIRERLDPDAGRLLHISGSKVAGDLAARLAADGFLIERIVGYHAEAVGGLSQVAMEALSNGHLLGVAHFSPRTAAIFSRLVHNEDVAPCLQSLSAFCLSDAVAEALQGLCWKNLIVAPRPDAESLAGTIALAGEHS